MSRVTNVIVTASAGEDEAALGSHLTAILDGNGRPFIDVDSASAGPKHLECRVFVGALNYIEESMFAEHLRSYRWQDPRDVRLFYKGEDDDAFVEYPLNLSA